MSYQITNKECIDAFFNMLNLIEEIEKEQDVIFNEEMNKFSKELGDCIVNKSQRIFDIGIIIGPRLIADFKIEFMEKNNLSHDSSSCINILDLGNNAGSFFDAGGMVVQIDTSDINKYITFRAVVASVYDNALKNINKAEIDDKEDLIKLCEKMITIMNTDNEIFVTSGYKNIDKLKANLN